jgi:hypothetical protein
MTPPAYRYYTRYLHYCRFNIPAIAEPTSPDNPLNMLKRIAKPEDYVVFKLDIDNSKIEAMFVEQLLASPELLALVDDFFFEHHVNVVS